MFAILKHTFAIQMQIYIAVVGTNLATLNTFSFFKRRMMPLMLEKLWHKKLWIEETDE